MLLQKYVFTLNAFQYFENKIPNLITYCRHQNNEAKQALLQYII